MEEGLRLAPPLAGGEPDVRLKTLTGNRLWARGIGSQATEVAIRVGVLRAAYVDASRIASLFSMSVFR